MEQENEKRDFRRRDGSHGRCGPRNTATQELSPALGSGTQTGAKATGRNGGRRPPRRQGARQRPGKTERQEKPAPSDGKSEEAAVRVKVPKVLPYRYWRQVAIGTQAEVPRVQLTLDQRAAAARMDELASIDELATEVLYWDLPKVETNWMPLHVTFLLCSVVVGALVRSFDSPGVPLLAAAASVLVLFTVARKTILLGGEQPEFAPIGVHPQLKTWFLRMMIGLPDNPVAVQTGRNHITSRCQRLGIYDEVVLVRITIECLSYWRTHRPAAS